MTRKHLREAMQEYPDAANEIKAWVAIVEGVRWHKALRQPGCHEHVQENEVRVRCHRREVLPWVRGELEPDSDEWQHLAVVRFPDFIRLYTALGT